MTNSQCDLEPKNGSKDEGDKIEGSLMGLPPDFPEEGKKEKAKEPFQANARDPTDPILILQDMLQQLMMVQKDLQKDLQMVMSSITATVAKEGKEMEAALLYNMEMSIKAHMDALWAHTGVENAKREKVELNRVQDLTNLITNSFSKELRDILGRKLMDKITALGPVVAPAVMLEVPKAISSIVAESVQEGVGDKVLNQLDETIGSKLEESIARQLPLQFQSSGNKALQEAVQASVDTSIIPAFERSCKVMFEQVDNKFHKGLAEHTSTIQKQIEAAHTPLALTLRSLMFELLDGQRKLISMVAAGNPKAFNPVAMQATNGLMPGLFNVHEAPLDPTKELAQLISERKYEEAFNAALQLTDISMVSWLCSQVDLHELCTMVPIPLTQAVLLALLQQLACDIANDTAQKATWMTDVAVTINPSDPSIAVLVRPIFNHVYKIVSNHQATLTSDDAKIKIVIHVINSVLVGFK